jgi:chemotaxis protein MotA
MLFVIGLLIVLGSVVGGYIGAHGKLYALWQPYEIIIIVGAAIGAFIISNSGHLMKTVLTNLGDVVTGGKIDKKMFLDLLGLIYSILDKSRKEGMMSIEADVDNPQSSGLFAKYPAIQINKPLADFIADAFRLIASGNMQPHELDALLDTEIEARSHEILGPALALQKMADAMPGFGIVAAVLGIVITMSALGGEPEELGKHIAAALVGTFMGVLLGYGVFGPIAAKMEHIGHEEIKLYEAAKSAIVASVNGMPPQLAVEFGRKVLFVHGRPSFTELEKKVRNR